MKLSRFIVMFVGYVAFFAMLFQFQPLAARDIKNIIKDDFKDEPIITGYDEDYFLMERLPEYGMLQEDWTPVLGLITYKIQHSNERKTNEIQFLFDRITDYIENGGNLLLSYATLENLNLLKEYVNEVQAQNGFIYGAQCKKITDLIGKIEDCRKR